MDIIFGPLEIGSICCEEIYDFRPLTVLIDELIEGFALELSDLIQNIGTLDLDLLEDLSGFLTLVGVEGHYSQPQPPTEGGEHDDENEAAFP